jgi:flagellar hook-basal body complex protein FliE
MRVEAFVPDVPAQPSPSETGDGAAFSEALDGLGSTLERAQRAEDAFAEKSGTLQDAMYERARADVALEVATAAAQRVAQAVQSVLNMQV